MSVTPIAPFRRRSPICGARPVRPQWATTPILNPINAPAAPPHSSNHPNNPTPRRPHPLTPHSRLETYSIAGTTTIRCKSSRPPKTTPLKNNPTHQTIGSTPHTPPDRLNPKLHPHLPIPPPTTIHPLPTRSIQSPPHSPVSRNRNHQDNQNPPAQPLAPTRLNTTNRHRPTQPTPPTRQSHTTHLPKSPPVQPPAG